MGNLYLYLRRCAVLLIGLAASVQAQQSWRDQNIYQIVTDRFFNGDLSNDNADGNYNPAAGQSVHGGDFKGIEQKLDYIKALGATAIWISPVVANGNGDYHGYAGRDFYNTAAHFGSVSNLKHLIDTAHAKGLLVIDDIVINHGAQLLNSNDNGYPTFRASPDYNLFYRDSSKQYAPPFDPGSGQSLNQLFHGNGFIQDFGDNRQVETGSLEGLDDFRTESSYIQTQMANIYKFWMDQGFDGFRVDTVKHVGHDFWDAWCPQLHQHAIDIGKPDFFTFGEVYDQSEAKVGSYTGAKNGGAFELDSALDYPLYYAITSAFAIGNGNTKQLDDHFAAVDVNYDPGATYRLVTFVDNHDQPRFLNQSSSRWGTARLQLALTLLYTGRGVPCLYYGTEQEFSGGADPNNREDMFAGQFEPDAASVGDNFDMTRPTFQWVAMLNNLRRLYPALRQGTVTPLANNPSGPGVYVYARRLATQELIVAMNTSEVAQSTPSLPTTYAAGTTLANLFDSTDLVRVGSDNHVPGFNIPALNVKIYVAQSQVQALDPVVTYITPLNDTKNVSTTAKITLQFSHGMDHASTEAAFSTIPATAGHFTWSNSDKTVTYQVIGGWPSLTPVVIQIAEGATDAAGHHFYGGFQSQFTTASGGASDTTAPTVTITTPKSDGQLVDFNHGISGVASDDVAIDNIEQRIDDGPWVSAVNRDYYTPVATVNWNAVLPFQYLPNGFHTFSIRVTDTSGNVSDSASINVRFFTKPGPYEQFTFAYDATNVGQGGCDNAFWESTPPYDPAAIYRLTWNRPFGYLGGNFGSSSNYISNVCSNDQVVYTDERYCPPTETIQYLFHCPPGLYEVTLHEAETFKSGPNQRRFDVYLQGQKNFPNVDVFAAAGGANKAVTLASQTTVANGLLQIQFKPVFDYARSSGIHVKKIGDLYSDSDGIPDWWRLGVFGHATGLAADLSRAGDDPDGDGQTNLQEFLAGTDPLNTTSVLKVTNIQVSGDNVIVTYTSAEGMMYQLQRSDSLAPTNWISAGSAVPGSGSANALYDYGGVTRGSPQFYRILVTAQ